MITNIENELLDVNKRTQPIIYTTDSIGFASNDRNCVVICFLPYLIPQKYLYSEKNSHMKLSFGIRKNTTRQSIVTRSFCKCYFLHLSICVKRKGRPKFER